jgi:tRNA threonylcarbamoyl adenosine modification protein YeaZ
LFMKILALEFSTVRRTVAVGDSSGACARILEDGGQRRGAFAAIDEVLREAGLELEQVGCVAVGLGPGSYNGIRSAIAIAQGWELARGTRLCGVSSAEAIAHETHVANCFGNVNVVIDAQRGEFYLGRYTIDARGFTERERLRIATMDEVKALSQSREIIVGPEVDRWFPTARPLWPHAAGLVALTARRSDSTPGEKLEPIYLREVNFVKAPPPRVIV